MDPDWCKWLLIWYLFHYISYFCRCWRRKFSFTSAKIYNMTLLDLDTTSAFKIMRTKPSDWVISWQDVTKWKTTSLYSEILITEILPQPKNNVEVVKINSNGLEYTLQAFSSRYLKPNLKSSFNAQKKWRTFLRRTLTWRWVTISEHYLTSFETLSTNKLKYLRQLGDKNEISENGNENSRVKSSMIVRLCGIVKFPFYRNHDAL